MESQAIVKVSISVNGINFGRSSTEFKYTDVLSVRHLVPRMGPIAGGTQVSVIGFNLPESDGLRCRFGAVEVPAVFVSEGEARCTVPPQTDTGVVEVALTANGVDWSESAATFEYLRASHTSSAAPSMGPASGGTSVTIVGWNFVDSALLQCRFGEFGVVPGQWISSTAVVCASPAGTAGSVEITISNNGVDFTGDGAPFVFLNDTAVHSVEPSFGVASGGTRVIVKGENFVLSGSLVCRFQWDSVPASFVDSETVECTSPESVAGKTVALQVSNNDADFGASFVDYDFVNSVRLVRTEPSLGSTSGGSTVRLVGSGFRPTEDLACRFGEQFVDATYLSDDTIECESPPSEKTGSVPVDVTLNAHDFSIGAVGFSYQHPVTVASVYPSVGPVVGGTVVAVHGSNFVDASSLACVFGDEAASTGRWVSSSTVECVAPPSEGSAETSVAVAVTNNGADFIVTEGITFQYVAAPTVEAMSPLYGPIGGGTLVTISGKGFGFSTNAACRFGAHIVPAAYVSSEKLLCATPPSSTETVPVHIRNWGYEFVDTKFTFAFAPVLYMDSIVPSHGPISGGTSVAISGGVFRSNVSYTCDFGGQAVAAKYVTSSLLSILCVMC